MLSGDRSGNFSPVAQRTSGTLFVNPPPNRRIGEGGPYRRTARCTVIVSDPIRSAEKTIHSPRACATAESTAVRNVRSGSGPGSGEGGDTSVARDVRSSHGHPSR